MNVDVAVVDYGVSNLCSVVRALEYLGYTAQLTAKPEEVATAPRLLLPGQGAFAAAMRQLQVTGLAAALQAQWQAGTPIMGICVGMQIMARVGQEQGTWDGLGWLNAECRLLQPNAERTSAPNFAAAFPPEHRPLKLPHVGWNELVFAANAPLLSGLKARDRCVYFAHSYALQMSAAEAPQTVIAASDYGGQFVAAVQKDNLFAVQFHPEKSQENGLSILDNFMNWNP